MTITLFWPTRTNIFLADLNHRGKEGGPHEQGRWVLKQAATTSEHHESDIKDFIDLKNNSNLNYMWTCLGH